MIKPFATENVFGVNLNYDDDFETLKNEVGKIGKLDYDLICRTSLKILKEKSKDIRVFSFLGFALLRNEDWEGFSDVYEALAVLFERDFESLYPDRIRAKESALKWLSENRFMEIVTNKKPESKVHDHIIRLSGSLARIKKVVESKFPNGTVFPEAFYDEIKSWDKNCYLEPVKNPQLQFHDQKSEKSQVLNSLSQQFGTNLETTKQAYSQIKSAASFLIQKEPCNQAGYRLIRCIRWDRIEKVPPSDDGRTLLTGPSSQQRQMFESLVAKGNWKAVLENAESTFASSANHLWLDLQRIAATACEKLGAEYLDVKIAIVGETILLIKRVPQILSLHFSDGSPFCDQTTKEFFTIGQKDDSKGNNNGNVNADSHWVDKEREETEKLFNDKGYLAALEYLQTKIKTCGNERENFIRNMTAASILVKSSQPEIAVSVLESLDVKVQEHGLVKWDPHLVCDLLCALICAYKICKTRKNSNQAALSEKVNSTLCKLSRLDVVRACSINQ